MAEATQEVRARLSVETEGDPAAFKTAAQGVTSLADSAGDAAPSLASITAELARLGDSVKEIGPAGASFQQFTAAVERFTKAQGIEEQRKTLDETLSAWKEFGEQVPEVLVKGSTAAKDFQTALEGLEREQERLADPLTASVGRARDALGELKESTESSFSGAEGKLVAVKQAVDAYRDALEEAKAAGEDVTAEQEAELESLEAEYKTATKTVADYGRAKREVKKDIESASDATRLEGKSINDLGDVAELASPKLGKLIGIGAAIVGAFTAGWAAGEKLRSVLNSLTDSGGGFDNFIQKGLGVAAVADRIANGMNRSSRETDQNAEALKNQQNIFENRKIDGFSQDIEANDRILQQHQLAIKADRDQLEEFSKSVGLSRQELDQQAAQLAKSLDLFQKANPQMDASKLDEARKQIQDLLDRYATLGAEVPENLQKLAESWAVTTSAVEEAAKSQADAVEASSKKQADAAEAASERHANAVKALVESITGEVIASTEELQAQVAVVTEAIESINKSKLSPEGLEKAREEVQKLVDAFLAAKVEIPASLAAAADKVGVLVDAMERAGGGYQFFTKSSEAAADSTVKLGVSADGTRKSIEDLSRSGPELAAGIDTGRESIESLPPAAEDAQFQLALLKGAYGEVGAAAQGAGVQVGTSADATAKAGEKVGTAGVALSQAGEKATSAAPPIANAAKASEDLGAGAAAAGAQVSILADNAAVLSQRLQALPGEVAAVVAALELLGKSGATGFAKGLLEELAQVRAAVKETKADLLSLQALIDDDNVSAPSPAASH
jgi:hypothetical protein